MAAAISPVSISSIASVPVSAAAAKPAARSAVFEERFRRITPEERAALDQKLATLPDKEKHIQMLLEALQRQDYNHEIFQNPNFPHYASEALDQGLLTPLQWATLARYWNILKDYKHSQMRQVNLFLPNGAVNPEARDLIVQSIKRSTYRFSFFVNEAQVDALFEEMKKMPVSEQHFFVMPDPNSEQWTISKRFDVLGFALFRKLGNQTRMWATCGLQQAFVRARFGKLAVEMNCITGLSSKEDIYQNGLHKTRDYAAHYPGVALSETADTFPAPEDDFSYHDFYHTVMSSYQPPEHSVLFLKIYDMINVYIKGMGEYEKPQVEQLADKFLDMECVGYSPEDDGRDLNKAFWNHILCSFPSPDDLSISEETQTAIGKMIAAQLPLHPDILKGMGPGGYFLEKAIDSVWQERVKLAQKSQVPDAKRVRIS